MRPDEHPLARHDLVWLDAMRWRAALLAPLADEWLATLGDWFARGRPAIVRRQESAAANALSLGVALAPQHGKVKIPLVVARDAVLRARSPLTLDEARCAAPEHWRPALRALLDGARSLGMPLSIYGSLSWQCLTGESYLTPSSDLDLLWRPAGAAQLTAMLGLLADWQRHSGITADGEIVLPDGSAVAWKELVARPGKLLVKRTAGVEMRTADEVHALLEHATC